jgi:hypothetical protein
MNIYLCTFDNIPIDWDGRLFLITEPIPSFIPDSITLLRVASMIIRDGETKSVAEERYRQINWDLVRSKLIERDMFIGKGTHLSLILAFLADGSINILNYDDIASLTQPNDDMQYELADDDYRKLFGYRLEKHRHPISPIIVNGEFVPFVCRDGSFIIPFQCPNKYKWWAGGMGLEKTLDTFVKPHVSVSQYESLLWSYCNKKPKGV